MNRSWLAVLVICGFGLAAPSFASEEVETETLLPAFVVERCYPEFQKLLRLGTGLQSVESWHEGGFEYFRVTVTNGEKDGRPSRATLETRNHNVNFHTVVECDQVQTGEHPEDKRAFHVPQDDVLPWDGLGVRTPTRATRIDNIPVAFLSQCYAQVTKLFQQGERFEGLFATQPQASIYESPATILLMSVSKGRDQNYLPFIAQATEGFSDETENGFQSRYECSAPKAAGVIRYR